MSYGVRCYAKDRLRKVTSLYGENPVPFFRAFPSTQIVGLTGKRELELQAGLLSRHTGSERRCDDFTCPPPSRRVLPAAVSPYGGKRKQLVLFFRFTLRERFRCRSSCLADQSHRGRGQGGKLAKNRVEVRSIQEIGQVRDQLEQQFGRGTLMRLGERQDLGVKTLSSGSILLDEALGCGGYPRGRMVEIYGPESSGKTTLTLHAIAECQRRGGTAAFIDAEHAMDPSYAGKLGVSVDDLWLSQPDYGEQALEIADALVRAGCVDVVVIDSVAALTPQVELNGEMGDQHVGLQARMMSQALRKLAGAVSKSGAIIFFINQIRMKIGVLYGSPETTAGGNALKFYASVRLDVRRGESLGQGGEDAVGHKIKVKVVKNKVAPPFRRVELDLFFGRGVSRESGLVEAGLQRKLLQRSGSWVSWADEGLGQGQLGQGRDNARRSLEADPQLTDRLEQRLRQLIFSKAETDVSAELAAGE